MEGVGATTMVLGQLELTNTGIESAVKNSLNISINQDLPDSGLNVNTGNQAASILDVAKSLV